MKVKLEWTKGTEDEGVKVVALHLSAEELDNLRICMDDVVVCYDSDQEIDQTQPIVTFAKQMAEALNDLEDCLGDSLMDCGGGKSLGCNACRQWDPDNECCRLSD